MQRTFAPAVLFAIALAALMMFALPARSSAMSAMADAMCNPVIMQCGCGQIMVQGRCQMVGPQANKWNCPNICFDVTNGFKTMGTCPLPGKCQATGTSDGKGPDQGLSQLGQALGQLMQQLMQAMQKQNSGSGSGTGTGLGTAGTCSDPSASNYGQLATCTYTQNQTCTDPTASNYGAATTCTYSAGGSGVCNDPTANNYGQSGACSYGSSTNTNPTTCTDPTASNYGAAATCTYNSNSSNASSSQYTQTQQNGNEAVTILGGQVSGSGSSSTCDYTSQLLGLCSQTQGSGLSNEIAIAPATSSGGFMLTPGGITISAGSTSNNTVTAGFYGVQTISGQPLGIFGQLCESRPWANNFLSLIISPSFFDGLCTSRGYQVGPPQTPTVNIQQTAPAPAATTSVQSNQTEQDVQSTAAPQVQIWAVPAAVTLDARTTVFWNTQGVTQCTETSPDGSFSENTLAGGAATVPLTGATTFSISCLDPGGNPVTDYVTVTIKS